jgi:hypothetical protein
VSTLDAMALPAPFERLVRRHKIFGLFIFDCNASNYLTGCRNLSTADRKREG